MRYNRVNIRKSVLQLYHSRHAARDRVPCVCVCERSWGGPNGKRRLRGFDAYGDRRALEQTAKVKCAQATALLAVRLAKSFGEKAKVLHSCNMSYFASSLCAVRVWVCCCLLLNKDTETNEFCTNFSYGFDSVTFIFHKIASNLYVHADGWWPNKVKLQSVYVHRRLSI